MTASRIWKILTLLGLTALAASAQDAGAFALNASSPSTTLATNAAQLITVRPAPDTRWGTWDGWGVSLCWWAGVFGQRDDLADLVFTTKATRLHGITLPGLGLNIARYNAGAGSTNAVNGEFMQRSPNLPAFREMAGYWLDGRSADPHSDSWDWTADANQRAMLLKARARGADRLELFSNSPMWWMCRNHNPSGAASGRADNLPERYYEQHAIYLANIAQYARKHWGITFDAVEAFNEPSADWWKATGTQEGCHFDVSTQASVIRCLRRELNRRGLTTMKVAASDENTYDAGLNTWNHFDAAVRAQVGRVNVHGYQYDQGRRDLLRAAVAGKQLWDSEYGDNDASGKSLAANLNRDFQQLHPTGWCYWQALDGGGWGLIQANPGENRIGSANRKYFIFAQYTRHIRPGMTIMAGGDENTVAAYDSAARKLVLVTVNPGPARWVAYDLARFARADGPVQRWTTTTSGGTVYQADTGITLAQRAFKAWFPADAVETFEIQNVDLPASAK